MDEGQWILDLAVAGILLLVTMVMKALRSGGKKQMDQKQMNKEEKNVMKAYDFSMPGLSQSETDGRNGVGKNASVIWNDPSRNLRRVIVDHNGYFKDFPGIEPGSWTRYLEGNPDLSSGRILYLTRFQRIEKGIRCLWQVQPDGRYWADEDGFGMENDLEIILYSDLDENGVFRFPFRIYSLDGKKELEKI